jgi:hypothetical protein
VYSGVGVQAKAGVVHVNVSTLGGFIYDPAKLVVEMHEFPRPNYKAITSNGESFTVEDNDFEPDQNDYWAAILTSVSIYVVPAAVMMLVYYIHLCSRGCCPESCTTCAKEPGTQRAALFTIWALAFIVILACYFPREKMHTAVKTSDDIIYGTEFVWSENHLWTSALETDSSAMETEFAKAGCSSATVNSYQNGLATFKTTSATQNTYVGELKKNLNYIVDKVIDNAETTVDIYMACLASLVGICILFAICAICNNNYVLLDVSVAMGNITYIIFFVAISAMFMCSLMLADYCVSPDKSTFYLIEHYMSQEVYKYASYYVTCGADPDLLKNAFEEDLTTSKAFVDGILANEASFTSTCSDSTAFLASARKASASISSLNNGTLSCQSLNAAYVTSVTAVCGDLEEGLVWLYLVMAGCSLFIYIVLWQSAFMRHSVVKAHEEKKKGPATDEEKESILKSAEAKDQV